MGDSNVGQATKVMSGVRSDFAYTYNTGSREHTLVEKSTNNTTVLTDIDTICFDDGSYRCIESLFGGLYKKGDEGVARLAASLSREIK